MEIDKEQLQNRVDSVLIEACQQAEEAICAEPAQFREQYLRLSEQSRCAIIFIKQWASDAALPIQPNDLDTILTLGFERSAPAGEHVHERIMQGLNYLSTKPGGYSQETDAERDSRRRICHALSAAHHALISSAFQTLFNVMILLNVDPDEQGMQTAVFLLAKLLDPDLGK